MEGHPTTFTLLDAALPTSISEGAAFALQSLLQSHCNSLMMRETGSFIVLSAFTFRPVRMASTQTRGHQKSDKRERWIASPGKVSYAFAATVSSAVLPSRFFGSLQAI